MRKSLLGLVARVVAADAAAGECDAATGSACVPFVERGELLPVIQRLADGSEPQVLVREMARNILERCTRAGES